MKKEISFIRNLLIWGCLSVSINAIVTNIAFAEDYTSTLPANPLPNTLPNTPSKPTPPWQKDIKSKPTPTSAPNSTSSTISTPLPAYRVEIVSPEDEETFQNEAQTLTVTLNVTPALRKEDKIVLVVDGEEMEPTQQTVITVPWLPRGSHTLQAKVISKKGKGAESDVITIYQQRTSQILNNRGT